MTEELGGFSINFVQILPNWRFSVILKLLNQHKITMIWMIKLKLEEIQTSSVTPINLRWIWSAFFYPSGGSGRPQKSSLKISFKSRRWSTPLPIQKKKTENRLSDVNLFWRESKQDSFSSAELFLSVFLWSPPYFGSYTTDERARNFLCKAPGWLFESFLYCD